MIDPHVHCRDGRQSYKETIEHVFDVADNQGVKKIFDMPNTDPPILYESDVQERLKLVPKNRRGDYFLYIGATQKEEQLDEAVKSYGKNQEIIGIKLYAGKSVGNLAVVDEKEQIKVYQTLTSLGYDGVIAVHCEKESCIDQKIWNPSNPITHSLARPKDAEIESLKDQIDFVQETSFNGILHICHVSCPESIKLIEEAREKIKITCGVTPHHILWSSEMQSRPDGLLYKMNPPLRDEEDVIKLRQLLKNGKINWIETDHAPHPIGEKLLPPYLSGFPSLYYYKDFVENFLPEIGLDEELIEKLTFGNISNTFQGKLF